MEKANDPRRIKAGARTSSAADGPAGPGAATSPAAKRSAIEEALRALVEECPAFVYLKDERLRHLYANRALREELGVSQEEFFGTRSADFLPAEVASEVEQHDRQVLSGVPKSKRLRLSLGEGEAEQWLLDLGYRLEAPDGCFLAGLVVDIAAQVEAEREVRDLAVFERLVSDVGALLAAVDPAELNDVIDDCVQQLAEALNVERAFVFRFLDGGKRLVATNIHAVEGLPTDGATLRLDLVQAVPAFANLMRKGGIFRYEPGVRIPEELEVLLEHLEADGVASGVVVPILGGGEAIGILGVDTVGKSRTYSDELVDRLRTMADILGATLARTEVELSLQASLEEVKRLREQVAKENVYLRQEIRELHPHHEMIGEDEQLLEVLEQASLVAATQSTVLILGETGTGKELLARYLHEESARAERPLVKVNCATLPASLVESELFGRERGAYTGAMTRQVGRFEVADGSTILLDEIGELVPETQVKLLRVLQEGEFERLGSTKTIKVDARVLAATNRDLAADVKAGRFREDLYYRLNVFPLRLPPLRDRLGDISLLTWHFVQLFASSMAKPVESIERSTMVALRSYGWPGNIRELRNVIERAMILHDGRALAITLPEQEQIADDSLADTSLDHAQRRHILRVMERTHWKVRGDGGAAELLRMKPSTLENRMKKLGIERPS